MRFKLFYSMKMIKNFLEKSKYVFSFITRNTCTQHFDESLMCDPHSDSNIPSTPGKEIIFILKSNIFEVSFHVYVMTKITGNISAINNALDSDEIIHERNPENTEFFGENDVMSELNLTFNEIQIRDDENMR